MTRQIPLLTTLAALLALLSGLPAQALNAKSWVANAGSDANDCSLAHPCATFQRAHDQTNPGGEVGVLTPGDYGGSGSPRLDVEKPISITNDEAGEASILAGGTFSPGNQVAQIGVVIDGRAGGVVSLRGLVVDGQGTGGVGIGFVEGPALHIQNCVIRNFEALGSVGILFAPLGHSQLFVSDTMLFNNGSDTLTGGIVVTNQNGGSPRAVLDRLHLENNVNALVILGNSTAGLGAQVSVRDSVLSGNAANGIVAFTIPGRVPAFAVVERSSIINNRQNGILADGPGATLLLLGDSTVARNGVGISTVNSGQLISYRNNRINNNIGPDGAPTSFLTLN